jgi:hypothetical protein
MSYGILPAACVPMSRFFRSDMDGFTAKDIGRSGKDMKMS